MCGCPGSKFRPCSCTSTKPFSGPPKQHSAIQDMLSRGVQAHPCTNPAVPIFNQSPEKESMLTLHQVVLSDMRGHGWGGLKLRLNLKVSERSVSLGQHTRQ